MKILHIINSLNTGGAEKLIVDTLPLYNERNIKADLLLLKESDTILYEQIKQTSVNIYSIHAKSFYSFSIVFKLKKFLKDYDIVHAHLFPTVYWLAICKVLFFPNLCIIFTEHSTNNKRRDKIYLKWFEKFIYSKYQKIICISKATERQLLDHLGVRFKSKVVVIENGVKTLNFRPNTNNTIQNNDIVTLTQIASFRYPKDQDTVIRSLLHLPKNIIVQFVGSGPRLEECRKLAGSLKVEDRVRFLGQRNDIPDILFNTDICILSSFYEGFGLAAVEGMASMKPILASNVEGLSEIVNGFGILFERGNEKQIAQFVLELINDSKYYKEVAYRCYLRSKEYDICNMVDNYIDVYKKELLIKKIE
ncbi:glycosyltransferase [Myroides odoratus]|uniref:glycosyltransferase n=1 Tax=Myroides odoratus TaxID=256 RepID=UPI0039B0DEAC